MFQIHGRQGRLPSSALEPWQLLQPVAPATRSPRVTPVAAGPEPAPPGADAPHEAPGSPGQHALAAYGEQAGHHSHPRQRLSRVAELMRHPVHTIAAEATLREAWHLLAQHRIGQAPVVDGTGRLVGMVGRAELLPAGWLEGPVADPQGWSALLARPVHQVMWSPIPSAAPDTELRRVAALLVETGLPGVPVTDANGRLQGFVARSDLLRALATDPPLDLWG